MVYNFYMITLILILINLVVFILVRTGKLDADDLSMSYYTVSVQKDYKRLITSAFTHYDIYHFLANMLSLYNIGSIAESVFGEVWMLGIYFGSMIIGKMLTLQIRHNNHEDNTMSLGASGAICGLLGAYLLVAMKAYGIGVLQVFYRPIISLIIMSIVPGVDGTSHISCLSIGMVIAYIFTLIH